MSGISNPFNKTSNTKTATKINTVKEDNMREGTKKQLLKELDNTTDSIDKTITTNEELVKQIEDSIFVTNIDGPLNHLENRWFFQQNNKFTEISFDINFEIENKFLNIIMEKSFQFGLNKIADSFQKRANDLFRGK